jgi:hypothetical protein
LTDASQLMGGRTCLAVLVDKGAAIISERELPWLPDLETTLGYSNERPRGLSLFQHRRRSLLLLLSRSTRRFALGRGGVVSLRAVVAVLLQAAQPEPWLINLREQIQISESKLWIG